MANKSLFFFLLLTITLFLISISPISSSSSMEESNPSSSVPDSERPAAVAEVHIIYTEQPIGEEPESFHIRILSSVLGSEEAAKEALLYSYKHAASGFSAKLTADQVEEISKQPGVLQVVKSKSAQLHATPAKMHNLKS